MNHQTYIPVYYLVSVVHHNNRVRNDGGKLFYRSIKESIVSVLRRCDFPYNKHAYQSVDVRTFLSVKLRASKRICAIRSRWPSTNTTWTAQTHIQIWYTETWYPWWSTDYTSSYSAMPNCLNVERTHPWWFVDHTLSYSAILYRLDVERRYPWWSSDHSLTYSDGIQWIDAETRHP